MTTLVKRGTARRLVTRLLAAIAQRETAARDMAKMWPGDWELSDRGWMAKVTADGPGFREVLRLAQEDVPDGVAPDLGDLLRHLALNGPNATLIRCAADRKTIKDWQEADADICDDSGNAGFARGLYRALERLAEGYGLAEQQEGRA